MVYVDVLKCKAWLDDKGIHAFVSEHLGQCIAARQKLVRLDGRSAVEERRILGKAADGALLGRVQNAAGCQG